MKKTFTAIFVPAIFAAFLFSFTNSASAAGGKTIMAADLPQTPAKGLPAEITKKIIALKQYECEEDAECPETYGYKLDLNGDGKPDWIVIIPTNTDFIYIDVFMKKSGAWTFAGTGGCEMNLQFGPSKNKGYTNIFGKSVSAAPDEKRLIMKLRWNGYRYVERYQRKID